MGNQQLEYHINKSLLHPYSQRGEKRTRWGGIVPPIQTPAGQEPRNATTMTALAFPGLPVIGQRGCIPRPLGDKQLKSRH